VWWIGRQEGDWRVAAHGGARRPYRMGVTEDAGAGRPRRIRRPLRASTYFWLLVLLACAGGGIYLWRGIGTREVYGADIDLPAYHQIAQSDVRKIRLRSTDVPNHATDNRNDLIGRYTLGEVRQDRPFETDNLGPILTGVELSKLRIVGLPASAADTNGGTLARGDRIDILLSSTAVNGGAHSATLSGVVVIDVRPDDNQSGKFVLMSGLSVADEAKLLSAGGTARIFILRVAPYTPP
jgi:hypothetical protein